MASREQATWGRRDSNTHWQDAESCASAIGLRPPIRRLQGEVPDTHMYPRRRAHPGTREVHAVSRHRRLPCWPMPALPGPVDGSEISPLARVRANRVQTSHQGAITAQKRPPRGRMDGVKPQVRTGAPPGTRTPNPRIKSRCSGIRFSRSTRTFTLASWRDMRNLLEIQCRIVPGRGSCCRAVPGHTSNHRATTEQPSVIIGCST